MIPVWMVLVAATLLILALIALYFFRLAAVRTRKASFPNLMPDNEAFREHMKNMALDREWLLGQPLERVSIESFDGLTLRAKLLAEPDDARILLLAHGYRSAALWDFPSVVRFYRGMGCGVLLIDQRASGESEGRYIGFGALERYDLQRWAQYLAERFPKATIYMDGVSMGATTVLLSLGLDLPENVRGAIADCGFTSPIEIMRHVQRTTFPHSGGWVVGGVRLLLKLFAKYDPADCSTLEALEAAKVPVLFFHGDADKFVPVAMTRANYEACASEKRMFIVPGAGHGESYVLDRALCERAICDFFDAHG